jgi:23S rRNA pseudouridine1911/1915/1917 synthase
MILIIIVPESANGLRLDKFLGSLPDVQSRSRALNLIQAGAVAVDEANAKASLILTGGEHIQIDIPDAEPLDLQPLDLKLDILFEDEHLLVLNKPAGLVVHPAAGHAQDTLVNALIAHADDFAMKFGENRPGIVHRLDKETSGLMVVAKTDTIQEELALQFKNRTIQRRYFAIVCGIMKQQQGTIKSFLARHPVDRKKFASIKNQQKKIIQEPNLNPGIGKWAHTDYEVIARHQTGFTYLKLKLHTGRTHQIRVHLSELGYPILGDETYGASKRVKLVPRFALHAAELGFLHPSTKKQMSFEVNWPEDYRELVQQLFGGQP